MQSDTPLLEHVSASAVRASLLDALANGDGQPKSTEALLDRVEASESAVYEALNALSEAELIVREEAAWEPTGAGVVAADLLAEHRRAERALDSARRYWRDHDATALPARFRRRLADVADPEILRTTPADPNAVVRAVAERLEAASTVDVVTPIYHDRFADAIDDTERVRLVLAESVVDEVLTRPPEGADDTDADVRVTDVSFALTVADGTLMLSLPRPGGEYDAQSELVADDERALEWGSRLFEAYWERATPVADYLTDSVDTE